MYFAEVIAHFLSFIQALKTKTTLNYKRLGIVACRIIYESVLKQILTSVYLFRNRTHSAIPHNGPKSVTNGVETHLDC